MSQLLMIRPNLEGLSEIPPLPPGYSMLPGNPGHAASMGETMTLAYGEPWDADRCLRTLLEHPEVTVSYVVEHDGEVVATASCKDMAHQPDTGYVHYVGTHPGHLGKKLGRIVTLATLHEFKRAGKKDAILNTDDWRLPAIRIYLGLGLVPQYPEPDHLERWMRIFPQVMAWDRPSVRPG
jgi:mycothiol synthase